jgi:DNA primase
MDVVMLAQHGVTNAVATLGTATTVEHLDKLFRACNDVVFCFDGDRAGRQAAWRALNNALPALRDGREIRFLFLPDGEDPDSLVSSRGREVFETLLAQAMPFADYLFDQLRGDISEELDADSIGGRARLAEQAKPLIEQVPAGIYRELLQQRLDEQVGVHTSIAPPPPQRRRQAAGKLTMTPMRQAICIALQQPAIAVGLSQQHGLPDDMLPGAALLRAVLDVTQRYPSASTALLLEHFRDDPNWTILCRLASWTFPDGRSYDAEIAQRELPEVLDRLRETAARLRIKALTGGDSPIDFDELRRLRDQLGRNKD